MIAPHRVAHPKVVLKGLYVLSSAMTKIRVSPLVGAGSKEGSLMGPMQTQARKVAWASEIAIW